MRKVYSVCTFVTRAWNRQRACLSFCSILCCMYATMSLHRSKCEGNPFRNLITNLSSFEAGTHIYIVIVELPMPCKCQPAPPPASKDPRPPHPAYTLKMFGVSAFPIRNSLWRQFQVWRLHNYYMDFGTLKRKPAISVTLSNGNHVLIK